MSAFELLLIFLGLYTVIPTCQILINHIIRTRPYKKANLKAGQWALITGCTSGIGEEIAIQFAEHGLNLILVSRNMARLQATDKAIKDKYPKTQTKIIQFDFLKDGCKVDKYKSEIVDQIDVNVDILVNNAGVNTRGHFKDISAEDVREMALVNTYPYTLLTKAMLPKMKKGSMILNICSAITTGPSAYDALYAATKIFEVFTFESIRAETKDYRILTMNPSYVSTNNARLPAEGMVETPTEFVKSMLSCMADGTEMAIGTNKHEKSMLKVVFVHRWLGPYNRQQAMIENIIQKKTAAMWPKRI